MSFSGEPFVKSVGAFYAIKWRYIDGFCRPVESYGSLSDCELGLYKFPLGEGYVGKAFLVKEVMFLPDLLEAQDFYRTDLPFG